MITSLELLNRLKVEKQLDSNRQVAAFLGISHSTVNRVGKTYFWNDDLACEIADMLDLDVDLVLLAIIAERSKNERAMGALKRLEENQKTA
ncbi:hypothetical protein BA953_24855 (plasmid) [Vibrio coralliilyticus]|uniref:hypothetical protein n=1 Tax=Vibrio coralliilyticus TaxID=190893 RepID=UPI000810A1D1|nr:hypothetical protein [Vibrio coralliilyticus]ANW27427.1 hypothetical protein BA953_24855 [Vibrio coralliilyticus]